MLVRNLCKASFWIGVVVALAVDVLWVWRGEFPVDEYFFYLACNYNIFCATLIIVTFLSIYQRSWIIFGANVMLLVAYVFSMGQEISIPFFIPPVLDDALLAFASRFPFSPEVRVTIEKFALLIFEALVYFIFVKVNEYLRARYG